MTRMFASAATAALLAGAALALSACNGGSASTAARGHSASTGSTSADYTVASNDGGRGQLTDEDRADAPRAADPRQAPAPMVDGAPMWAANRRHTSEENANYQFQRDGADFGARDVSAFVRLAHAFTTSPPHDVLSLTRSNGDKLLYDPKRNIFAVVTKDGAPRAMFKPQAGKAYWDQQVQRQNDQGSQSDRSSSRRNYSRRSGGSDSSDDQG